MGHVRLLDPEGPRHRLDRYDLLGEIASGGMATVYLGRLAGMGGFQRLFAIKILHPHLAGDPEFVNMFLDEARIAALIHHPHVVPILEVGTSESGYYLVMEYIEGDTLARLASRAVNAGAGIPRPVLLRTLVDALSGLHAAHELCDEQGMLLEVVHRDCSPQNILVGADGSTRLTDFGVARAASRLSSTRADRLKGKLSYMAPEQTRGDALDRRADVFAMGVILWEMLACRRLFKAESEAATISRIIHDPIPRVRSAAPEVPEVFDEVCARSLERDPARRFQSAAEMADALERAAGEASRNAGETGFGLASPREVAAYVEQLLGAEIAAFRDSLRGHLGRLESRAPASFPTSLPSLPGSSLAGAASFRPGSPGPESDAAGDKTTRFSAPSSRAPGAGEMKAEALLDDEDVETNVRIPSGAPPAGSSRPASPTLLSASTEPRVQLALPEYAPTSASIGTAAPEVVDFRARRFGAKHAAILVAAAIAVALPLFLVLRGGGGAPAASAEPGQGEAAPASAAPLASAAPRAAPPAATSALPAALPAEPRAEGRDAVTSALDLPPAPLPNASPEARRAQPKPPSGKAPPPPPPQPEPSARPSPPAGSDDDANPYR